MKRWIHSSTEMPEGYLGTTKFTARNIETDDQRNALEALEIAISEKFKQFDSMIAVQFGLTSGSSWEGTIDEYPEGYYIQLTATRSSFNAFVSGDSVIRKPRNLSDKIGSYLVSGDAGTVYYMSKRKSK